MVLLADLHFRQLFHCPIRSLACPCMRREAVEMAVVKKLWVASVDITIS